MPRLLFTPAAKSDLSDIWDYTVATWGREQAVQYIRQIQADCDGILDGRKQCQRVDHIKPGYFRATSGSHMIFFKKVAADILVVRILHQKMDPDRHF